MKRRLRGAVAQRGEVAVMAWGSCVTRMLWGLLCLAGANGRLGPVRRVARCSEQHRFTRRYIPAPLWGEDGVGESAGYMLDVRTVAGGGLPRARALGLRMSAPLVLGVGGGKG